MRQTITRDQVLRAKAYVRAINEEDLGLSAYRIGIRATQRDGFTLWTDSESSCQLRTLGQLFAYVEGFCEADSATPEGDEVIVPLDKPEDELHAHRMGVLHRGGTYMSDAESREALDKHAAWQRDHVAVKVAA